MIVGSPSVLGHPDSTRSRRLSALALGALALGALGLGALALGASTPSASARATPATVPPEATVPVETVPPTVAATPAPALPTESLPTETPPTGGGELTGPTALLDVAEVAVGGRVSVTLDGFGSAWATVSVCGNEARRGSQDCLQSSSVSKEFPNDGSPIRLSYVVEAPPVPCPCVIRAVGANTTEVAVAALSVAGHPIGPLVDPVAVGELVAVTIDAQPRSRGALGAIRAELGGRTNYEVIVTVRNTSNAALADVRLSGSVRRGAESLGELVLDGPGPLGVGQSWRQTVETEVPSPSFGEVEWYVLASGAGPSVESTLVTSHRPWLLILMVLIIVVNIGILLMRWRVRRRREREGFVDDVEVVGGELSPSGGRMTAEPMVAVGADR